MNIEEKQGEKIIWSSTEYGGETYNTVTELSLKKQLDLQITFEVVQSIESAESNHFPPTFAELGAGRAPISNILKSTGIECLAIDRNLDMAGPAETSQDKRFRYIERDLTNILGMDLSEKVDVATMENCWYATTLPSEGTRNFSDEEALYLRKIALVNAASIIQEGGTLIISDPLQSAKNLGLEGIADFVKKEAHAARTLGNSSWGNLVKKFTDRELLNVLKENKTLTSRCHFFKSEEEVIEFVESTGLFTLKKSTPYNYIGSNTTLIFERTGLEAGINVQPEWDKTIIFDGQLHPDILGKIGDFRKDSYTKGNVNRNVPRTDRFDKKPEGRVVVMSSRNSPQPIAVATMQQPGEIGLEIEELIKPLDTENEISLEDSLRVAVGKNDPRISKALENGENVKIAEIRRLATALDMQLSRQDVKRVFTTLNEEFTDYAEKENLMIVFFMTDESRGRFFNMANRNTQFKKLEGFELKRDTIETQSIIISGADYFLKDWRSNLEPDEVALIEEIRSNIHNGETWKDILPQLTNPPYIYESAINKLFSKSNENSTTSKLVEDGVSVYYTVIDSTDLSNR